MQPYLPQYDSDKQKRLYFLNIKRREYEFDFDYLAPLPMLKKLPKGEEFSQKYQKDRKSARFLIQVNGLLHKVKSYWDPVNRLEDYDDFFILLRKTKIIKSYKTDASFAEQRLSGANPMMLRSITELPPHFSFTLQEIQAKYGQSLNLEQELNDGNLYITDYSNFSFVKGGISNGQKQYLPNPSALFCWQKKSNGDRSQLVPVAILMAPDLGKNSPLVTPADDPALWWGAKTCVQIADANQHEIYSHLCWTHFVLEAIAAVTARQLAENHPLQLLLKPHFLFLLPNNFLGRERLVNEGGPVQNLLAGSLEESLDLIKDAYKSWSFDQFAFPTELKNRGMNDCERLPHYPYRDDGMLLWDAITNFVSKYLQLYYKNTEDITGDEELQNWATEMTAQDGGRVKGFPEKIETFEQLVEVVTTIIFTAGPQHSAVNFPQYDYMSFVPNMPFAAYQEINADFSFSDETIMSFIPGPALALRQTSMMYLLGTYHYDKLGYYEQPFADPNAAKLVKQFQQNLKAIEQKINIRNKHRLVEYKYFKPSQVLNSTSI